MYTYITRASDAEKLSKLLMSEPFFAYDTETTGLDPHTDKVILASVSTKDKTYIVDTRDVRCLKALTEPLEKEEIPKIGLYLLFDGAMSKGTAGIDLEGCWDVRLGEKCLEAGLQWDGFDLETITKKWLGKDRDKSLQTSFVGHTGDFSKEQLRYAADDTADLVPIAKLMKEKIIKEGLLPTWKIENQAIPAFTDIYFYGLKIDTAKWTEIMSRNWSKLQEAETELEKFFEPFFDRDLFGKLEINFNSQPQILYGLQRMGIKIDGDMIRETNDMTRKKVADLPVIKALAKHREALKAYGTYGQPYLDAIHPNTGRIHPKMDQYGTDTGRATCPKPNVLNIPKEIDYRHAFITDPGRLISTVDFAGAELRILADLSGDPLMIRGFNSGVDYHCFVAAMLLGRESVAKNDPIRTPVKNLNFGLAYGMGPRKLYDKLNGMGHKITFQECKDLFMKYMNTFKIGMRFLKDSQKEASRNLVMRNINGRRRRWHAPDVEKYKAQISEELAGKRKGKPEPEGLEFHINNLAYEKQKAHIAAIEREGANCNIQSVNVEWTKTAMYEIRKECKKRGYDAKMYNSVYDETVLDVSEKDAKDVHELQKKIMIECGGRFTKKVPVLVEGHLVPYWTK